MADRTYLVKTIGTTGRDYATVALWDAGLGDMSLGYQIGVVYADSVFTEYNTYVYHLTSDYNNYSTRVDLIAAKDEAPIWRPGAVAASYIIRNQMKGLTAGLDFDGVNLTAGILFQSLHGANTEPGQLVIACRARNGPAEGFYASSNYRRTQYHLCLADNNAGDGFRNGLQKSIGLTCCGSVKNGGMGLRGYNDSYRPTQAYNCYFLGNIGDDADSTYPPVASFYIWISDTSLAAGDDIHRSVDPTTLGFTDWAGDDFRLAAGSPLLQVGQPIGNADSRYSGFRLEYYTNRPSRMMIRDVFNNNLTRAYFGERFDIGPHQLSYAPASAATPTFDSLTDAASSGELVVVWTSAEDWVLVVDDTTGDILGGGSGASGGVTIGGLTDGNPYTIKIKASSEGKTDSGYSGTKTATPTAASIPTKCSNVAASNLNRNQDIRLTWDKSSDDDGSSVDGYQIYSGTTLNAALTLANSGADYDFEVEADGSASYVKDVTGYTNNIERFFVVRAVLRKIGATDHADGDGTHASATPATDADITPTAKATGVGAV